MANPSKKTPTIVTDDMLNTITQRGKAVPSSRRFNNCASFMGAYRKLYLEDNESRATQRGACQGLVDCNPPLPQDNLNARGERWRANFSTQQGRAIRDSNSAALWSLQFANETLAEVVPIVQGTTPAEVDLLAEGARRMAINYSRLLRSWPDYYNHEMAATNDIVTHGIGWYIWYDELDPHHRYVPHGAVKYPPRMRALIDEMNVVFVEVPMSVGKLLGLAENEKASDMGWNRKAIASLLIRRYGDKSKTDRPNVYDVSDWESTQQQIKNNDLGGTYADMETVPVVYGFVVSPKEDSVSVYIAENTEDTVEQAEYLLERHGKRKTMMQAVCPCFYNIGDGYFRSIKGVINLVLPQLVVANLSLCATADAAYLMGTVILEDTGSNDMRLTKIGPVTRLPAGSKPMQQSFSPKIEGFLTLYELMSRLMNNNAGVYKRTPENIYDKSRTAEEVKIQAEQEARLESFQATLYYLHQDRKHTEIMRRLLEHDKPGWAGYEDAEKFRKWCKDAGVPAILMKMDNIMVRTTRTVGHGSATMARMSMQALFGAMLQGVYDQNGAANIIRDFTAMNTSWEIVDRYAPRRNRDMTPSDVSSFAALENNDIAKGQQVQVGDDQNHYIHALAVGALLSQMGQAYLQAKNGQSQPLDPRTLLPAFVVGLPHLNQHLAIMARNQANKAKAKQLYEEMKIVQKYGAEIQKDAEKINVQEQRQMQEEQARIAQEGSPRDPVLREEARKDAVVKADIARDDATAASDIQRKTAKTQVDLQAKALKTMANLPQQQPMQQIPAMQPIPALEEQGVM